MRNRSNTHGQATLELALLLPILFALAGMVLWAFRTNHQASDHAIAEHNDALIAFNHGDNQGAVVINGVEVAPARYEDLLPPGTFPLSDIFKDAATGLGLQIGLNNLLSHLPFDNGTYLGGAALGGITGAVNSFVGSNFKSVDWESVGYAAVAGSAGSRQANHDFQEGMNNILGSGLQAGAQTWASSKGKGNILAGVVGGALGSKQMGDLMGFGGSEILSAASRAALSSSVVGAMTGNFRMSTVLQSTGRAVLGTEKVAGFLPGTGGLQDKRMAATYGAASSMLSSAMANGKKMTFEDLLYSGADGAFFSNQTQGAIGGKGKGFWANTARGVRSGVAGAGYSAGKSALKGESGRAVGFAALNSAVVATGSATVAMFFANMTTFSPNFLDSETTRIILKKDVLEGLSNTLPSDVYGLVFDHPPGVT